MQRALNVSRDRGLAGGRDVGRDRAPQRHDESRHWSGPIVGVPVQMLAFRVRMAGAYGLVLIAFVSKGPARQVHDQ